MKERLEKDNRLATKMDMELLQYDQIFELPEQKRQHLFNILKTSLNKN